MIRAFLFCLCFLFGYYTWAQTEGNTIPKNEKQAYILVLGVAQDGGYPHMACTKECCAPAWQNKSLGKYVVSLALVDPETKQWWLFEASPDIKYQINDFGKVTNGAYPYLPSGIFLTHAHIGHYAGLIELGKEVMNARKMPVYALGKMKNFLEQNGPWSQLVKLQNIEIKEMDTATTLALTNRIQVQSFTVPHRDEFSETAGFSIATTNKKYLFIPDIDKWEKWNKSIIEEVHKVDIAFVDATFLSVDELKNRKIEEVPHPLVSETIGLFEKEEQKTKAKIHFIHFNHSNPLLWNKEAQSAVIAKGFRLAEQYAKY